MKKEVKLENYVGLRNIQKFQDRLAGLIGIGLRLIDSKSFDEITVSSRMSKFNLLFGMDDESSKRAYLSEVEKMNFCGDDYSLIVSKCSTAYFVIPVSINDKVLAYLVSDYVRIANPDIEECMSLANLANISIESFIDSLMGLQLFNSGRLDELLSSLPAIINSLLFGLCDRKKLSDGLEKISAEKNNLEKKILSKVSKISSYKSKYHDLLDDLPDIAFSLDSNHNFVSLNIAIEVILGYRRSELLGKSFTEIVSECDLSAVLLHMNDGDVDKECFVSFNFTAVSQKGLKKFFSLNCRKFFDEEGQLLKCEGVLRDISDLKKMEEKLLYSECKFKSLIENAADIIYTLDSHGHVMSINKLVEEKMGYKVEEITGRHFSEFVDPEDLFRVTNSFYNLLNRERPSTEGLQFHIKRKNGDLLLMELNSRAIYDEFGKILFIEGILRDKTREFNLRKRLMLANERYKSMFDSIIEARFITDVDGLLIMANKNFLDLFKYQSESEILSRKAEIFYANVVDRRIMRKEVMNHGFVKNYRVQMRRSDNSLFNALVDAYLLRNAKGKIIGIQGKLCRENIRVTRRIHCGLKNEKLISAVNVNS